MNLWKDIPAGNKPPELLNMVIEIVTSSRDKYEYRSDWEAFVLDRVIPSSAVFPVDYGFVPQTWYDDNDPLDVMVLTYEPLEVGCIVKVRVIGASIVEDEIGEDAKILSVPVNDFRFDGYHEITAVHPHVIREIQEFFETYKRLEPHRWVRFKEWRKTQDARKIVTYSMEKYKELMNKKK